ncbi:MAG: SurA N-terminal domain-containing protein [Pseudomonadota bacterium]
MLQTIRDRAQGWLAYIIIGLLIIPFALWGIQEYASNEADVNVARVDDVNISQRDFQRSYEQQRERMRTLLGENAALLDETRIKQSVLDGLIRTELLRRFTGELGLRVSDAQLAQQIQSMPEFQSNGQFSRATFSELLRRQGLTPERFESLVRATLLTEQLNSGITSTAMITRTQLDEAIRLKNQQREIGYLVLPWSNFKKDVTVDEAAVMRYYEDNRERFVTPEQVRVEYVELAAQDLAAQVTVDEQELRKLYDEQRAAFTQEEQRRAGHILIKSDKNAEAAKAKAEELLKRLRAGEPFDKLAKENSEDAATAQQGGDLGFFGKGVMDKAFEDSVFALKTGELSGVVRSAFGFHIIKLTEIKPAQTQTFEQVRADLEKELRQRKAQQLFFEKAEPLANLVYEHPDTLAVAAKELGLTVKTSDLFGRHSGGGIGADPKVVSAAFSEDVLTRGFNSEPIDIGENRRVVVRLKEHKPAAPRALAEVKQEITEQLLTEAAQQKAEAAAQAIEKRLRAGEDAQAIAKDYQVQWQKIGPLGRDATSADPAIVRAAFALGKPAANRAAVGGTRLASGDYAVIAVFAVKEGSPASVESAARLAMQRQLQRSQAGQEYENFVAELRNEAEITIHQDKL